MSTCDYSIRPLHPHDAEALYVIITNPVVTKMLFKLPSMEFSETVAWVEKQVTGRHRLVIEKNGTVIGSGHISHEQNPRRYHSGRLGLMIHPNYWGQGAGSAMMTTLLNIADNWLDLKRIQLEVYTHNTAAFNLYQPIGVWASVAA